MKIKTQFKIFYIAIITFALLHAGCHKNETSSPSELKSYANDQTKYYSMKNVKTIAVSNNIGGVMIAGWSLDDSMRVYMYKTIESTSSELAEAHFNDIKFISNIIGDTMEVEIETPQNSGDIIYKSSSLSLEIPYNMNCVINNSNGAIFVDQLNSTLTIANSIYEVEVDKHEGSCKVSSSNNIVVQSILLNGGYCKLSTAAGNVSLSIPDSTDGTLNLKTDEGTITYTNLSISQLSQTNNLLTGVLGDGNAEISIYAKKGDIKLNGLR